MANPAQGVVNTRQPIDAEKYLPAAMVVLFPTAPTHDQFFAIQNRATTNEPYEVSLPAGIGFQHPNVGISRISDGATNFIVVAAASLIQWRYDTNTSAWWIVNSYIPRVYSEAYGWTVANGWEPVLNSRQLLITVGAGGSNLQAAFNEFELRIDCSITATITLTANNQDVEYEWLPTISAGTLDSKAIYNWGGSSRSAVGRISQRGVYLWRPAAAGDTFDLDTSDIAGAGSSSRFEILANVRIL